MTILWLSIGLLVALFMFFMWTLCLAAKRGDEMDELAQFHHGWDDRPLDEVIADLRAVTKAHNVNFDGFNPQTREWEPRS